jgi:spore coat protein U-like protein
MATRNQSKPILALMCLLPSASALAQSSVDTQAFEVRMDVAGTCAILTASDIDFGSQTSTAGTRDQQGTLSVQCTKDTAFTLGLDGGTTTGQVSARAMTNSPIPPAQPVQIAYTLSRDAFGGSVWGNDSANWYVGRGLGLGSAYAIDIDVYARATLVGNEPAGAYRDTVTATLTY